MSEPQEEEKSLLPPLSVFILNCDLNSLRPTHLPKVLPSINFRTNKNAASHLNAALGNGPCSVANGGQTITEVFLSQAAVLFRRGEIIS